MPWISRSIKKSGIIGGDFTYDDMQGSINNLQIPAANYPDPALYNMGVGGGVTFPVLGFAVGEYIFFDVQTSHSMKLNTILDYHIHYILPNTTDVGHKFKFQLDVVAAGIDGVFAVPTGSPFVVEHVVSANDNTTHRLLDIAEIPASNTTVSSLYRFKLTRIASAATQYASDVYLLFNDCHYQIDRVGSLIEKGKS